mgnify:CR=1 FL=1
MLLEFFFHAGFRWIDIRSRCGHGIFAAVHEDSGVAHVGGRRVGDGHRFRDALVLEMADGVDIWSSNEGGKCAKVGGDVGVFQFLDGGHVNAVVCANGGTTNGGKCTWRVAMQYWCGELNKFTNHC